MSGHTRQDRDSEASQTWVDDVAEEQQHIIDMILGGPARVPGEALEKGGGDIGEQRQVECNDCVMN